MSGRIRIYLKVSIWINIITIWLSCITIFQHKYLWLIFLFICNTHPCREVLTILSSFEPRRPPYGSWNQTGHTWHAVFCQVVVVHSKRPSPSLSSGQGAVWTLCPSLDVQHSFVSSNQWLNHVSPTYQQHKLWPYLYMVSVESYITGQPTFLIELWALPH